MDKSQPMITTGTCLVAKSLKDSMCTTTLWGPVALLLRPITSRELLPPLVGSHNTLRKTAQTWHMLVADDYLLEASGPEYRSASLVFFVLCAVSGAPLSWNKMQIEECRPLLLRN